MSQHQGVARSAPPRPQGAPGPGGSPPQPAPPAAAQTSAPGYLQQRVAFPAPVQGSGVPRVLTGSGRSQGVGGRLARTSTPRLLAVLMALCAVSVLLFGTVATSAQVSSAGAMERASHNAAQLVRVQNIKAQVLQADALATNAFLVGGLESAEARAAYDAAVDDASRLTVEAGEAQPADAEALQVVNSELVLYSAAMAQARANNRLGYPVGASYLSQASLRLREDVVPALDAMTAANTERIAQETGSGSLWAVGLLGAGCIALLSWTLQVLARRFKRRINVGVLVATGMVLAGTVVSLAASIGVARTVSDLEFGALNGIRQLSTARTAAFDAKALESLTLVARGSGEAYEEAWVSQSLAVLGALDDAGEDELATAWQTYVDTHTEVRGLDDGGDWDSAVETATQDGEGLSNATSTAFQEQLAPVLDADVVEADQGLLGLRTGLWIGAGATVLLSLGGAAAALLGLQTRRREYE